MGRSAAIGCDAACHKAWGIQCRPLIYLDGVGKPVHVSFRGHSYPEGVDPDNHAYIPDQLLGDAPADPGTYEGGHGKSPRSLNKWCARQCERCAISDYHTGELEPHDFSDYVFNIPRIQAIVGLNPRWREEFAAAIEAARGKGV